MRHCDRRDIAGLVEHGIGAARDGVGDERAPVAAVARQGDEDVARRDCARIEAERRRLDAQPLEFGEDLVGGAHISSLTGAPAIFTGRSGTSWGTPSVRSAPSITWANTGAATSPP